MLSTKLMFLLFKLSPFLRFVILSLQREKHDKMLWGKKKKKKKTTNKLALPTEVSMQDFVVL